MLPYIGQAAHTARLQAGARQLDVGDRAGVSHAAISRFEAGKSWPKHPDRVLAAYAAEAGLAPLDLWARAVVLWVVDGSVHGPMS